MAYFYMEKMIFCPLYGHHFFWCGYIDSDKPHKHLNMLLFMILMISVWIICSFSFDFSFETCWGVRNSGWVLKQTEIKVFQWWNQSVNVGVQQSVEAENKQWGNICKIHKKIVKKTPCTYSAVQLTVGPLWEPPFMKLLLD